MPEREQTGRRRRIPLRLDPAVYEALTRWARDELRGATSQMEFLLREALSRAGRLPGDAGGRPRRGRPGKNPPTDGEQS